MKNLIEETKTIEKRIKKMRRKIAFYKAKIRLLEAVMNNLKKEQSKLHIKIQEKAADERD